MSTAIKLSQKILFNILAPALAPDEVEEIARKINIVGPEITSAQQATLYNHLYFTILGKIQDYLKTDEAKQIDKLAPHVSAGATFGETISENIDRILPQVFTIIAEQKSPPPQTLWDKAWAILGY